MAKPNFNCQTQCWYTSSSRFKDDVWHPVTRLFDDRRKKRRVRVSIRVWPVGWHYYAKLKQDDNPAWDGEQWCLWHDDPDGRGAVAEGRFGTMREAKEFVRREMKKRRFRGHKLWKDSATAWRPLAVGWLYKYDGD